MLYIYTDSQGESSDGCATNKKTKSICSCLVGLFQFILPSIPLTTPFGICDATPFSRSSASSHPSENRSALSTGDVILSAIFLRFLDTRSACQASTARGT